MLVTHGLLSGSVSSPTRWVCAARMPYGVDRVEQTCALDRHYLDLVAEDEVQVVERQHIARVGHRHHQRGPVDTDRECLEAAGETFREPARPISSSMTISARSTNGVPVDAAIAAATSRGCHASLFDEDLVQRSMRDALLDDRGVELSGADDAAINQRTAEARDARRDFKIADGTSLPICNIHAYLLPCGTHCPSSASGAGSRAPNRSGKATARVTRSFVSRSWRRSEASSGDLRRSDAHEAVANLAGPRREVECLGVCELGRMHDLLRGSDHVDAPPGMRVGVVRVDLECHGAM